VHDRAAAQADSLVVRSNVAPAYEARRAAAAGRRHRRADVVEERNHHGLDVGGRSAGGCDLSVKVR
jgi:hypothetical protein